MDLCCESVRETVNKFLNNILPKSEFSRWTYDAMYSLLAGGILEIEKLPLWGLITLFAQIDDFDPCSVDEIKQARDVLTGQISKTYIFEMMIPQKYVNSNMIKIRELLLLFNEGVQLSKSDICKLQSFSQQKISVSTIMELLETQISGLLASGYSFYADEALIKLDVQSRIFISDEQLEDSKYFSRILRMLDCSLGMEPFCVHINFKEGIPTVSVMV